MPRYAIVENGVVVNFAAADSPLLPNWIPWVRGVKKGDSWDGSTFTTSLKQRRQDKLQELSEEAKSRRKTAGNREFTEDELRVVEIIRLTVKDSSLDKTKSDTDTVEAINTAEADARAFIEGMTNPETYDVVNTPSWP